MDTVAAIVSQNVGTVMMDHVTEMMGLVAHVQLGIMAVRVARCVLTVTLLPVIKIVAYVHRNVSVNIIFPHARAHVLMVAWTVVIEKMQLVIPANRDYLE